LIVANLFGFSLLMIFGNESAPQLLSDQNQKGDTVQMFHFVNLKKTMREYDELRKGVIGAKYWRRVS
jgi:hypothetical protein